MDDIDARSYLSPFFLVVAPFRPSPHARTHTQRERDHGIKVRMYVGLSAAAHTGRPPQLSRPRLDGCLQGGRQAGRRRFALLAWPWAPPQAATPTTHLLFSG